MRGYTYTPAGLLASASYGGRTLANTWDADSNRVGTDANGSEYAFVYDTTAGVPAVIAEVQPDESVVYYYREPDGSLIARRDGSDWRYYHFDALGSTRLITDSYGYVTDAYAYDAYGALLSHDRYSGSIDQPYQFVGEYGYYTHWMEPDFGLLQLGVRYYDPTIGRFTQIDPAKDGINWYAYVDGNPVGVVDPSGLQVFKTEQDFWRYYFTRHAPVQLCIGALLALDLYYRIDQAIQAECASLKQGESGIVTLPWIIGGPPPPILGHCNYTLGYCLKVIRARSSRPARYLGRKWPWGEGRCWVEVVFCEIFLYSREELWDIGT